MTSMEMLRYLGANVALVTGMALVYSLIPPGMMQRRPGVTVGLLGCVFGVTTVLCMQFPVEASPGVILDGKTIVAPLAGYFFGLPVAAVMLVIAVVYRVWLGGIGMVPGIAIMGGGAVLGVLFHRIQPKGLLKRPPIRLLLLGLAVYGNAMLGTLLLPSGVRFPVLARVWLPAGIAYPTGLWLAGMLLQVVASRNATFEDIARAAESLRLSESRYRQLAEGSADVITRHALDGTFLYVSPAIARLAGYEPSELLGKLPQDCIDPRDLPNVVENHRLALQESLVVTSLYRFRRADGTWVWLETISSAVRDPVTREVTEVEATTRDVTERKQADDALRESEEQFRRLFEAAADAIFICDTRNRIVDSNRAAGDLLQHSHEELLRMRLTDVMAGASEELWAETRRKVSAGQTVTMELTLRRRDGSTSPIEVRVSSFTTAGVPLMYASARDISERKRAESLMLESEKMRMIGGLAAGMAHEINNPLAGMIQSVDVVMNRLSPDLEINHSAASAAGTTLDAVRSYMQQRSLLQLLEAIRESGKRAADIVSNMLSFSRSGAAEAQPSSLRSVIDDSIALAEGSYDLRKRYDFRKVQLVREYDDAIPVVRCRASEIQQVMLNLLTNAAEAMADRADSAQPPRIVIRTRLEQGWARVEVEDNGPGMDESVRNRVFDPFFTTKGNRSGTGLGLFVSYLIISRNHGGTFSVESVPGQGTKFTFRMPLPTSGGV